METVKTHVPSLSDLRPAGKPGVLCAIPTPGVATALLAFAGAFLGFVSSLLLLNRSRIRILSNGHQRTKILPNVLAIALFLLTPGSNSLAETLVVPNGYENTPGEGAKLPFGGNGLRYQNWYGANLFADAMPEGGLIHEVSLRIDESNHGNFTGSIPDLEMRMSTTPSLAPVLTFEYSRHLGTDYRSVFSRGALSYSIPGAPDDALNSFGLKIPLKDSFYYDPRNGGLLIELWVYQRSTTGLLIDAGRSTDARGIVGNISSQLGEGGLPLIMELTYTAVPEPSSVMLCFFGALLLMDRRRIRSLTLSSQGRAKMLPKALSLALFLLAAGSNSFAETLVVPDGYENTPGEAAQLPFAGSGGRWQNIYAADLFLDSMPVGGFIHEVSLRIDESDRRDYTGSVPDFEMRMSTTPSRTPVLTLEYARHVGSDYQTVFPRGTLSYDVQGAPNETVNPFTLRIPLDEPFYYDQRRGGLLIEFWVYESATTRLYIDGGRSPLALANGGAISSSMGGGGAPVVSELRFTAIPEPQPLKIIAIGAILLLSLWRKR